MFSTRHPPFVVAVGETALASAIRRGFGYADSRAQILVASPKKEAELAVVCQCWSQEFDPASLTALFEEGDAQRAGHLKGALHTQENAKRNLAAAKAGKRFEGISDGFAFEDEFRNGTAIGSTKTVPLVEPIDLSAYVAKEEQRRKEDKRRKWTDASGTFSVSAIFARYSDGKVELLKEDGSEVAVPLSKLSKTDQEYVRKEIAKSKVHD